MRETSRFLKKRLYEHHRALLKNKARHAPIIHRNKEGHNFNLKGAKIINYIYNK